MILKETINYAFELSDKYEIRDGSLFLRCECGSQYQLCYSNTHFIFVCFTCKSYSSKDTDEIIERGAYHSPAFHKYITKIPNFMGW
jgi:hypothetical protein